MDFYSLRWNDNQTFIFKLLPGNYSIRVTELKWGDTGWVKTGELGPEYVLVLRDTSRIIEFPYNPPKPINPESDLILILKLPETIMTDKQEITINGTLIVGLLQTANESLRNLDIEIEDLCPSECDQAIVKQITPKKVTINRIFPGQALIYNITINTKLLSDVAGGYITLRAELNSAEGERTGKDYSSVYSRKQTTIICKLTKITGMPDDIRCEVMGNCDHCDKYCKGLGDGWSKLFCRWGICCCVHRVDLGVIPRCGVPP